MGKCDKNTEYRKTMQPTNSTYLGCISLALFSFFSGQMQRGKPMSYSWHPHCGHPGALWVLPRSCVILRIMGIQHVENRAYYAGQVAWPPQVYHLSSFWEILMKKKSPNDWDLGIWMVGFCQGTSLSCKNGCFAFPGAGGVIFILSVANKHQNTSQPFNWCSLLITRNRELQLVW